MDELIDVAGAGVSLAVREMCCRLATDSGSFARAAGNLQRLAQVKLSDEKLRQLAGDLKSRAATALASEVAHFACSPTWVVTFGSVAMRDKRENVARCARVLRPAAILVSLTKSASSAASAPPSRDVRRSSRAE